MLRRTVFFFMETLAKTATNFKEIFYEIGELS